MLVLKSRFWIFLGACLLGANPLSNGATLKSARVSVVIKDVRLLSSNAAPRPAAVNDNIIQGTAVRTGIQSRAELTFADLTVSRLGENTIFSFNEATRELNVTKGAILVEVPSKAPAARINTAAVTAAVTGGTGLFATGPPVKFMVLEGIGTFYPAGHAEKAVAVHAGEMVMMTADGHITQPTKFNVQLVLQTSHLIVDFPDLASLPLILQVVNQQLAEQSAGTANQPPSKNPVTDVIDLLTQNVTANPAIAATPALIGPPVISSPVPFVIGTGTVIATHPTITTNGVTGLGVLYRGLALDGPVSAFAFGSTSPFDITSGFDTLINGNGTESAAVFKFTSLQLAGNPTIDTKNGPIDLGLIAVHGITSGAPGGTITFAGLKGVLLATQKGSINLDSEISFSGFHDLNIYARGATSDLMLGSDISTTSKVRLFAERDLSLTSSITTDDLYTFVGRNVAISGTGVINAPTITLSAGQNLMWNGQTSDETAVNSSGDVSISAGQAINIANEINITRHNGMVGSGLNVSLSAGTDLIAANNLAIQVDNSMGGSLDTGGNVTLNAGGNLTVNGSGGLTLTIQNTTGTINNGGNITLMIGGSLSSAQALNLVVENFDETANPAGHIGTGGNISLTTGGNLTADSISVAINNRGGGVINSGASLVLNIGGALTTFHNGLGFLGGSQSLSLTISSRFDDQFGNTTGSFIGGDATLLFHSDTASIGGTSIVLISDRGGTIDGNALLNFSVRHDMTVQGPDMTNLNAATWQILNDDGPPSGSANPFGGMIHGSATVQVSAANLTLSAGSLEVDILNKNGGVVGAGGTIDSDASITFNLTGNLTTQRDASFGILNQLQPGGTTGGTIGGDATISVEAANILAGGGLDTRINNTGGSIGGNATINMNVSGTANVTTDATFEILGSNGVAKGAAINFNGGSYSVGGTFLSMIDGDGAITFNNASVRADIIKVGVLGTNGTLTIGGGAISANTLLKLYASGSNGILNFVANVTLSSGTAANLAANTITIQPSVVVTISGADGLPANIYTNNANYSGFGGTNPANGTFAGNGANRPLPLSSAPPFGDPPGGGGGGSHTLSSANQTSSSKLGGGLGGARIQKSGEPAVLRGKTTGPTINVASSEQLLSLLDAAVPGPGGKITIPASKQTIRSGNSSRINGIGRSKGDRGTVDTRRARDSGAINPTTGPLADLGANKPQPLASARSFAP